MNYIMKNSDETNTQEKEEIIMNYPTTEFDEVRRDAVWQEMIAVFRLKELLNDSKKGEELIKVWITPSSILSDEDRARTKEIAENKNWQQTLDWLAYQPKKPKQQVCFVSHNDRMNDIYASYDEIIRGTFAEEDLRQMLAKDFLELVMQLDWLSTAKHPLCHINVDLHYAERNDERAAWLNLIDHSEIFYQTMCADRRCGQIICYLQNYLKLSHYNILKSIDIAAEKYRDHLLNFALFEARNRDKKTIHSTKDH